MRLANALAASMALLAWPLGAASAQVPVCPAAADLPQLVIDDIHEDPVVPVEDTWQVYLGAAPLSDAQVALLAADDTLIDRTESEMRQRGAWVYMGLAASAFGTAASSAGWVLFGQGQPDQKFTLPIALGGIVVGMLGVLLVTESIQVPLEPHMAPTPRHRLSRAEMQRLVAQINTRLHRQICDAIPPAP